MNSIKNLGYRTDCIFHEHNGFIEERPDYYVIRTPSNPDFWFGDDYRAFKEKQMDGYREMSDQGSGDWWGAFFGDDLVGGLGLFFDRARGIGRFQNVATDLAHRRKGVCTTLLDHVGRNAFKEVGVKELVIVTGDGKENPARSVYQSAGYVECMKTFGLTRSRHGKPGS